jgi:hypothetical protein
MIQRPFAVLKRSLDLCAAIIAVNCTIVQAAPLGHIALEGRKAGNSDWSSWLIPAPGDVIEYRLLAYFAPIGANNGANTIVTHDNSGFQSLSLQIRQDPSAPIHVSFNPPLGGPNSLASFRNGWGDGMGARPGALTPRANGTGNDLTDIRPVHAVGVFSATLPQMILSGSTFTITQALPSSLTVLTPSWGTGSGAMRINGFSEIFITADGKNGADPLIGFRGLTLGIPEPASNVIAAIGLATFIALARRRRRPLLVRSLDGPPATNLADPSQRLFRGARVAG